MTMPGPQRPPKRLDLATDTPLTRGDEIWLLYSGRSRTPAELRARAETLRRPDHSSHRPPTRTRLQRARVFELLAEAKEGEDR